MASRFAIAVLLVGCMAEGPPRPQLAVGSDDALEDLGPGIGEDCDPGDVCALGLTCLHYYSVAGPRGPEFATCEMHCKSDASCPGGSTCEVLADGPGQVCR
jgi:hypothetical protein